MAGLLVELGVVFLIAVAVGLVAQRARGRDWGDAAHRAFVVGVIVMLIYFVGLIATDIMDLRPEPPAAE